MARFPAARLLLALLVMAVTNAQVDQSQYSVPCVMQYVGCVGIRNFNDAFSRLLGATYGSLYDGYYCRCSIVPLISQHIIVPVPESYCNRYDDIFFLVDILVHLGHVLVNFDDNLSDNHRHITNNVFTHFNILILLDDLSNNVNLNKLIDLINSKLPSQHPRPRPARTSTVYRLRRLDNDMVSDVDLLFNPTVANRPACPGTGSDNPFFIEQSSEGQLLHESMQRDAFGALWRCNPIWIGCADLYRVPAGRELPQHYEFGFVFDCLLYFDHICFIVQLSHFEHLSRNIVKQLQLCVLLKHHHTSDQLKLTSDFGLFSFHYSSGEHFQQRIHPCNSTPFLDVYFRSRFNTFCNALRQLDSKQ
ncbi:hypothetical protein CSAL01_12497 [Colletotrichum salicis]|uniref:Uncharacterized protein n=1 Tax=Colletotrichum salicis TaxID=1209931 RepID=A0A135V979_9PEZI|nr:hypothetical protein CSAL01_12497 [Colletotrichum salicis]